MAKKNKLSTMKLISLVLIVVGAGLAIRGYQKSGGFNSQLSNALTGSHSDNVMMLYISAAACVIAGLFLFVRK